MSTKRSVQALVSTVLMAICLTPQLAWADGMRKFDIALNADTKDVHIQIAGDITKVTVTPTGPTESNSTHGTYNALWNTPPGQGTYSFEISRKQAGGKWNLDYWLTTTGEGGKPDRPRDGHYAALFTNVDFGESGFASIFGENESGATNVVVGDIVATVVSDPAAFFSPTWYDATGVNYSFAGGLLVPGALGVPFGGPFAVADSDWIKITTTLDGRQHVFAYDNQLASVPEPSSIALGGPTTLALLTYYWRRRRQRTLKLPLVEDVL